MYHCCSFLYKCRAFGAFAEHFPEQAAIILGSFDTTRQRQLLSETSGATASVLDGIIAHTNSREGSKNRSASAQRRPLDEAGIIALYITLKKESCIHFEFKMLTDFCK